MNLRNLAPFIGGVLTIVYLVHDLFDGNYKIAIWELNTLIWISVCIVDNSTIAILKRSRE